MADLEAMRYPTKLVLGLADHTYVRCCGGAKAWGCWGGSSGGTLLRTGAGSSRRADAIAAPNERAGITCYAVNGVCHQAANRILLPAAITVFGARGYGVSSAIYGVYGRPGGILGLCRAPFHKHAGVSGDLPACVCEPASPRSRRAVRAGGVRSDEGSGLRPESRDYQKKAERLFAGATRGGTRALQTSEPELVGFMVESFMLHVAYHTRSALSARPLQRLAKVRGAWEVRRIRIEREFAANDLTPAQFGAKLNALIREFQDEMAELFGPEQYSEVFGLERDERIGLADPRAMKAAYPD